MRIPNSDLELAGVIGVLGDGQTENTLQSKCLFTIPLTPPPRFEVTKGGFYQQMKCGC